MYPAADMNKDGKPDLFMINAGGDLYSYYGRGNGTFQNGVKSGNGWGGFMLVSGADLNADGRGDIVSVSADRKLYYYRSTGPASFAARKQIGQGW
jgi:hypothetical protein